MVVSPSNILPGGLELTDAPLQKGTHHDDDGVGAAVCSAAHLLQDEGRKRRGSRPSVFPSQVYLSASISSSTISLSSPRRAAVATCASRCPRSTTSAAPDSAPCTALSWRSTSMQ